MSKPLDFERLAIQEARQAFRWYARRSVRAAIEFREALRKAYDEIETRPQSWPEYLFGTRVIRAGKFPYLVVYRERPVDCVIVAVAHASRRPGYWKKRLG